MSGIKKQYVSVADAGAAERAMKASGVFSDFDSDRFVIFPGFCDVHVHFREPGFSYKETVASGSSAAARGGFTDVCTMPNLNPVPDSAEHLAAEFEIIKNTACVNVHPYGALTVGEKGKEPADLDGMSADVAAFSDDGKGVQSESMMEELMLRTKALGKVLAAHCEDESLLHGGYIHDGEYARAHGHPGICSESEWGPIERDLRLAEKTGCAYHVCHVSAKESVDLIRRAKARGVNVTCETAPHYIALCDSDLKEDGRFKMNPPLRSAADRDALIEGICDGTVDMIATDHAPHSEAEKSRGLAGSPFGVVGLETSFAVCNTYLVRTGIITMEKLVELMAYAPRRRFGISACGFSVFAPDEEFTVNPDEFLTVGRATPFDGATLYGVNYLTAKDGRIIYERR